MKSFLKQVLAFLVALTIFAIGSCAYVSYQFRAAYRDAEIQRQADEEAELHRRKQFNDEFLEMHNEMINRPTPVPPVNQ